MLITKLFKKLHMPSRLLKKHFYKCAHKEPPQKVKVDFCKTQFKALEDKKFKPVTHVIFNLDGVVLNTERLITQAHIRYLSKFKKSYPHPLRLKVMGTREDEGAAIIIKEYDLPMKPSVYSHGIRQYMRYLMRKAKLIDGARNLVCHLSMNKIPIALVSSDADILFNVKTENNRDMEPLMSRFCHIILGSDPKIKVGKPFPDHYLVAMSKFHIRRKNVENVLAIENSYNGVKAAKAAGMQTILMPDPYLPKEQRAEADLTVDNLEQIDLTEFRLPELPFLKMY